MDIEAIDRMAVALSKVMAKVPGEMDEQRRQLSALPSIWLGEAGDSGWNMLNAQVSRAEQDRFEAATISLELSYAATALRTAVRYKAGTVQKFWASGVADIPQQDGSGVGRKQIDDLLEEALQDTDEGTKAKDWLRNVFVPHVHATHDKFLQVCKEVDTEVRRIYGVLIEALNGLDTAAYPMPQESKPETPVTPETKQPSTGTPSTGTPSTGSPATTEDPTATNPATTTDDDKTDNNKNDDDDDDDDITDTISAISDTVTDVVSGLTTLASSVSQLESLVTSTAESLTSGLTSLSTSIQEGFASLSSQLNSLVSGAGATFDLNGTQVSVATDANGQLTLSTTDSAGNSHEYGLTLDANGMPVVTDNQLTTDIGSGTPETGTGQIRTGSEDATGESQSNTTAAPTGSVNANGNATEHNSNLPRATVPNTEEESDGEHWAGDYPVAQQPQPGDSGAELAEAGPL
ncbi:hypothetical protein [Nocardia lasii]|uniref:WXG100 family type VII secretion target n=1 Tax=Nocardia lasii TaxID=1616107 RepID=A0ABW1JL33_9NOCA